MSNLDAYGQWITKEETDAERFLRLAVVEIGHDSKMAEYWRGYADAMANAAAAYYGPTPLDGEAN